MNNYDDMNQKSNMIIYTTEDGLTKIETTFDEDTVWLSIDQMAELFQRDKSTISRHMEKPIRLTTIVLMLSFLSAIV